MLTLVYISGIVLLALVIGLMSWPLKRAYLFGLGWSLIYLVILSVFFAFRSVTNIDPRACFYVALMSMALSVVAFRAAKSAPPHRSNLHAVIGWLIGFVIIYVAWLALGAIELLLRFGF